LAYTVVAAVAQHESERILERVKQGKAIARAKGVHIGRPPVMTPRDIYLAKQKIDRGECSISDIAKYYKVHPRTLKRALKNIGLELG